MKAVRLSLQPNFFVLSCATTHLAIRLLTDSHVSPSRTSTYRLAAMMPSIKAVEKVSDNIAKMPTTIPVTCAQTSTLMQRAER